jgi:putative intracellular protease/amidase
MKKEILVFISENYADWEGAYVCSRLNKPETDFSVKTLAINKNPIKSIGGFTVIPDYSIQEIPADFHMLILIGGTSWLKGHNDDIKPVIDLCITKEIPVAAICDACTFLADKGYLDHIEHTGNSSEYLEKFAKNYKGTKYFIENQVVSAERFITANGTSAIEFAKEILNYFGVMQKEDLDDWYHLFKVGFYQK